MVKNVQSLQAQEFEKKKLNKNKSNKYSAQFWELLWLSFPSLLFFSFTLSKALTLNTPHQIILYDKMRSFKFAPRGFSLGTTVFPSTQRPLFPNSNSTRNQVD